MNKEKDELQVCRFCRIDGCILYITSYTVHAHAVGPDEIHLEGILREDYAAYITHRVIGENQEPYRTVAEIAGIPMPEPVRIRFSADAKFEMLSNKEAMQEQSDKQMVAMHLLDELEDWARYSKSSFYLTNISDREAILTIEWLKRQAQKSEQGA